MHFPDFVTAPNIAHAVDVYERENQSIDPTGALWRQLRNLADWKGRSLLDLGCGTGYWLPRYSTGTQAAAEVIGVEPDPTLLPLARQRQAGTVLAGSAEHIPLPDASIDVIHARFAYFFPPGCDAGLAESLRVLRPGGALIVIDNDHRAGEFAELLARSPWAEPQGTSDTTDAWWAERGADRTAVLSAWRTQDPGQLAEILRNEFPPDVIEPWLETHPDRNEISYGYALFRVNRPDTTPQP